MVENTIYNIDKITWVENNEKDNIITIQFINSHTKIEFKGNPNPNARAELFKKIMEALK